MSVFVKDHLLLEVPEVLADRRFLAAPWEPGERPEWRQYARWHLDASASSGFERHEHVYRHTVENSPDLARFAAHHRPFYERLYAQRLDVTPWEHADGA